jgi:hypothetical protein
VVEYGTQSPGDFTVSLYDTATGALIERLTPNLAGLETHPTNNETLAWSEDGSQLMLVDSSYGAITIWGSGAHAK